MRVGFVYPHIFGTGGYPRDIYRLFSEICMLGEVQAIPIPAKTPVGHIRHENLALPADMIRQINNVDILHFFGFFFPIYPFLAKMARFKSVSYVVSPLGGILPNALNNKRLKKSVFVNVLGRSFLQRAAWIHAFTNNELEAVRALGVTTEIIKQPFGLYPEDIPNTICERPDFLENNFLFCFGRLDIMHKGIDILLDGFDQYVREKKGRFKLVIAGRSWNGSHRLITAKIEQLKLNDHVKFLGEISESEKFTLIKDCRAFVYPTRHDGPPRPIRDALSLNKRILTTYQANICDNIERLGWGYQFNPAAPEFAEAISKLERELAPPAYVDPLSLLEWAKIAEQFSKAYCRMQDRAFA